MFFKHRRFFIFFSPVRNFFRKQHISENFAHNKYTETYDLQNTLRFLINDPVRQIDQQYLYQH